MQNPSNTRIPEDQAPAEPTAPNGPAITITPPMIAVDGDRHPRQVALTLPVELPLGAGDTEPMTQAERAQFNFYMVAHNVADDLARLTDRNGVEFWPEDILTAAAACLLMADEAWRQWRSGRIEECLVTAHAAQQAQARFDALEALPPTPKTLSEDTAHVVLRGVPATNHTITQVDGARILSRRARLVFTHSEVPNECLPDRL